MRNYRCNKGVPGANTPKTIARKIMSAPTADEQPIRSHRFSGEENGEDLAYIGRIPGNAVHMDWRQAKITHSPSDRYHRSMDSQAPLRQAPELKTVVTAELKNIRPHKLAGYVKITEEEAFFLLKENGHGETSYAWVALCVDPAFETLLRGGAKMVMVQNQLYLYSYSSDHMDIKPHVDALNARMGGI